jgi:hypothetical protein
MKTGKKKRQIFKNVPTNVGNRDIEVIYEKDKTIIRDVTFEWITEPIGKYKDNFFCVNCENKKG